MHQRDCERAAGDRLTATSLLEIADEIHSSRHLVDAAFMASESLTPDVGSPLCELLSLISTQLKATAARLSPSNGGHANAA